MKICGYFHGVIANRCSVTRNNASGRGSKVGSHYIFKHVEEKKKKNILVSGRSLYSFFFSQDEIKFLKNSY
jgi:hypothetical protein